MNPRAAPQFRLENRTGYDTADLRRFFEKGLLATGTRGRNGDLRIVVSASPIRSRGCAEVGEMKCDAKGRCAKANGARMIIAIAAPWRFSLRRLARLFEHECAHIRGIEHEEMSRDVLLSLGPTPDWAKDSTFKYYGAAPPQLPFLRRDWQPPARRRSG